jgi:hypothetical protein
LTTTTSKDELHTKEGGRMLRDAGKAEIYVKQRARPSTKKKKEQSCLQFVVARVEVLRRSRRPNDDDGVGMQRYCEGPRVIPLIRWESRNAEDDWDYWLRKPMST